MAASSLLALLDDIATLLDDVAVLSKVAAKKTAGVLGDDLALNAEQVTGVKADRELPVVFAVFKGSLLNKAILVPAAIAISAFVPWLILPLLMIGGGFLCFEGFEKVFHKFFHKKEETEAHRAEIRKSRSMPGVDLVKFEKKKIKGAIRTDFILSAELIVISLGTVADESLTLQFGVLVAMSIAMTVGVYGLVGGIVKMDDAGLALTKKESAGAQKFGNLILTAAPILMKTLSVAGTIAMFLVGGGIMVHGIAPIEHFIVGLAESAGSVGWLVNMALGGIVGVITGGLVVAVVMAAKKVMPKKSEASPSA